MLLQEKQPPERPLKLSAQSNGRIENLWIFSAGTVVASVVQPEQTSSAWSRDSTLLQGKQPTETPLKIWVRSNGRIKTYGPFQLVLWSRR